MILMICPRDYTLRTQSGHIVRFEAGKPTPVPEALYAEALARNIMPATEQLDTDSIAPKHAGNVRITGPLRDALVYDAIQTLLQRNNHEDFDAGAQPKAIAIEAISGVKLSNQERTKYYDNYRDLIGSNSELPTHPNVALVQELQSLTTRAQLKGFAEDQGYDFSKLTGRANADLKAQLLSLVINNRQSTVPVNAVATTDKPAATLVED